MKLTLFLSVVSAFTVFHLCKAGPLPHHLQKRAAFYIANETACVVDNIVYSNGDPIPTDDPCEACRCRPPGFACVLKECKIKPGCRAVRHAGECCPEYICGCEHNGRFYKDGDEIKDPQNPCYQCFCQGSSIACAFVDCIYRDECDSVFVPGECCPQYTNCTRDIPDRNLFLGGGNVLPPVNLLPPLNDEAVLPEVSSIDQAVEPPKDPENPIQPQDTNDNVEKEISPENISSNSETTEPESLVTEAKGLITEVEEKATEPLESAKEEKQDLPKGNEDKEIVEPNEEIKTVEPNEEMKTVEPNDETKIILNSESDVNKDDVAESSEPQNLKLSTEAEKELSQTTVENKSEVTVSEEEITEKPLETEATSTKVAEKEPQIRNSAAENSKSLKLTDDDQLKETYQQNVKSSTKTGDMSTKVTETTSAVPIDNSKESSTTEDKLQSEENAAEESQTKVQATPFYKSNAKIKSESAETVTIVVHVKESSKIPTETDYVAETVTPASKTSVSEENILKSNHEIDNSDKNKESAEAEDSRTTKANFEIFPTTVQKIETEVTSKSPSPDQNSEDIQGRSDEADNIAMEAEENPVSEKKVLDSKSEDDSLIVTSTMGDVDIKKEVRTDEEITEEIKADEPTSTVIKTDASRPITIKTVTDSTTSPKPKKSTTESQTEKIEELRKEQEMKKEDVVEAAEAPEVREETAESKEKEEEITLVQPKEESIKEEKSTLAAEIEATTVKEASPTSEKHTQDSTTSSADEKPETRTNDETETEKTEEKTSTESDEKQTTEEKKSEVITETQQPIYTTLSDNQ